MGFHSDKVDFSPWYLTYSTDFHGSFHKMKVAEIQEYKECKNDQVLSEESVKTFSHTHFCTCAQCTFQCIERKQFCFESQESKRSNKEKLKSEGSNEAANQEMKNLDLVDSQFIGMNNVNKSAK